VAGSGDSGSGWTPDGSYGGGSGLGSSSSGVAAGVTRRMNVVGQFDLSHGYTIAAEVADAAWSRAQQAIAAATNPAVSPPSPFNGIRRSGPVITWSFASGSGTSTSPISGSVQSQYQAVIERAIQTWAAATGLTFTQVPASAASDIQIGWGDFDTTSSGTVGYTSSAGDNAGQIQSVIVRLEDPAEDPLIAGIGGALTYSGTQTELYQVALHEIGHALGLAESSDPNSVMFPLLGPSNTSLDATDITDVDALYNPTAVAGGSASALLAQAMSSFGVSLPPATASFPISTQTTQPTLAASTMH